MEFKESRKYMDIGQIHEEKSPRQRQEIYRLARSLAAERYASTQATVQANQIKFQPHEPQESLEISEDAAHALSSGNDSIGQRRTSRLVAALENAWSGGGHEPTRRDRREGLSQRRRTA